MVQYDEEKKGMKRRRENEKEQEEGTRIARFFLHSCSILANTLCIIRVAVAELSNCVCLDLKVASW